MSKNRVFTILSFVIFYATTLFTSRLLHYGNHTLSEKRYWSSAKDIGRMGLMGSTSFNSQRQSLAFDRLNLGEWYGNNEVVWHKLEPWTEVEFDFQLDSDSYLWFFFKQSSSQRVGFRISRNSNFPLGLYFLDSNGKILERAPVALDLGESWTQFKLATSPTGSRFFIDGKEVYSSPLDFNQEQIISFRSGVDSVRVDNLVSYINGSPLFAERFSPETKRFFLQSAMVINVAIYLFLGLLVLGFSYLRRRAAFAFENLMMPFISAQTAVFVLILLLQLTDQLVMSRLYFYQDFVPFNRVSSNEVLGKYEYYRQLSFFVAKTWEKPLGFKNDKSVPSVIDSIFRSMNPNEFDFIEKQLQYIDEKGHVTYLEPFEDFRLPMISQNEFRIAYMGTSQTWGAGAADKNRSFASLTTARLNDFSKKKIVGINLSMCGSRLPILIESYEKLIKKWKPNLLVVNLSNNDPSDPLSFSFKLQELLTLNSHFKIKTVFILEANNLEVKGYRLKPNHQTMTQIAESYGIPVFDLHGFMRSKDIVDAGLNWWDVVHFDQNGHNLVSQWLSESLKPVVAMSLRSSKVQ